MGLIDTHAHLTDANLIDQIDDVMARAAEAGVDRVISVASTVDDTEAAIALAQRFDAVHATAGIHPHEAGKVQPGDWERLPDLLRAGEVVACGEMGLDYHYDFADRSVQRDVFARQLSIASQTDLPLIIHCREAMDDTIALLLEHGYENRKAVFHCFTGTKPEADRIAAHGWWYSFTGIVTYKSASHLHEVVRGCPADKLMVETDSPYLSPVPVRGKSPNEPAHVAHTARFIADLRGEICGDLVHRTTANACSFYSIVN